MKIKYLQYECEDCGHQKQSTLLDLLKNIIVKLAIAFSLLVICLFIIFFFSKPESFMNYGTDTISRMFGLQLTIGAQFPNAQLREVAGELVKTCEEGDRECIKYNLFKYLQSIKYVGSPTLYPVEQTIVSGIGDCKNMAYAYSTLLYQVNEKSHIVCNSCHCVSITTFFDEEVVVDLANDYFGERMVYNEVTGFNSWMCD